MRYILLTIILLLSAGFNSVANAEIRIGWIGPLSGSAAVLGVDSAPAVQLAIDEVNNNGGINGQKISLFVEDDQYEASKTVTAYQNLVHNKKVKILIVVTYGGIFALAEKAKKDGVILIDPLDCDSEIAALPENVICIAKRTESLGQIIAAELNQQKLSPAALLYFDGDPFMGTVAQAFKENLQAEHVQLVHTQTYNNADTDLKSFVARAKKSKAKALVLLGYDQLGSVIRSIRE